MLLVQNIRDHFNEVAEALKKRNIDGKEILEQIVRLDDERKQHQRILNEYQSQMNNLAKEIGQLFAQGKKEEAEKKKKTTQTLKEEAKKTELLMQQSEDSLRAELIKIPNTPHTSVPAGKTPEENQVIKEWGTKPALSNPLPHWDLASQYSIIDFELGVKLTGAGFPVYLGAGAKLQRALISFFLDENIKAGYLEVLPPFMVNEESGFGTGQLPDKEGQMYHMQLDNYYMVPTAEVPVTNIYRNVILKEKELPVKLTAYTPCFRREAGSYGKDVRGLNRVHQFDKVEIVQIAHPGKSYLYLEEMVAHVEMLLQKLELHYRVIKLCGGDMGFASAITYDLEVWAGGQNRWLECSSVSNFETFQSNRLKLRFKANNNKTYLAHTLNGSSLALPRIVAALLENNQTTDGIVLPKVLHTYCGIEKISLP